MSALTWDQANNALSTSLLGAFMLLATPLAGAQDRGNTQDTIRYEFDPITVTATRSPRPMCSEPPPESTSWYLGGARTRWWR